MAFSLPSRRRMLCPSFKLDIREWGSQMPLLDELNHPIYLSWFSSIVYRRWENENAVSSRTSIHRLPGRELSLLQVLWEWKNVKRELDDGLCNCRFVFEQLGLPSARFWSGCEGCRIFNSICDRLMNIIGDITRQRITSWPMIAALSNLKDRLIGLSPSCSCQGYAERLNAMLVHFFDCSVSCISYTTEAVRKITITPKTTLWDLRARAGGDIGPNIHLVLCNPWQGAGPTAFQRQRKEQEIPSTSLEALLEFFVIAYLLHLFKVLQVAQISQRLTCILFVFWEYPNRLRHACTTMPWTIWPALVVLWGVCWMFYEPNVSQQGSQLNPENEEEHSESFRVPVLNRSLNAKICLKLNLVLIF
jgi:hypothetical protein